MNDPFAMACYCSQPYHHVLRSLADKVSVRVRCQLPCPRQQIFPHRASLSQRAHSSLSQPFSSPFSFDSSQSWLRPSASLPPSSFQTLRSISLSSIPPP